MARETEAATADSCAALQVCRNDRPIEQIPVGGLPRKNFWGRVFDTIPYIPAVVNGTRPPAMADPDGAHLRLLSVASINGPNTGFRLECYVPQCPVSLCQPALLWLGLAFKDSSTRAANSVAATVQSARF